MTLKPSFIAWAVPALILGPTLCYSQQARSQPAQAAPAAPRDTSPQVLDVQGGKIRVITMASGLFHPWGLAFVDANTILVTERNGALRIIKNGVLAPQPVWTAPAPAVQGPAPAQGTQPGQGGQQANDSLHFVALHPDFAQNHLVYVSYPKRGEKGFTLAVARGFLKGDTLGDVQEIFVADAWETGGNLAGRVFFGKDKSLYVTVGDRDRICCNGTDDNSLRMKSQALDNDVGKTLRLRDDGTIPPDNPFVGKAGARPEVYTVGHRDQFGIAPHPTTGQMFHVELGPYGGDKVNILKAGADYGWPDHGYGRNNDSSPMGSPNAPGIEPALLVWIPGITPSGLLFYTGDRFPAWKGNLMVGGVVRGRINGASGVERVVFNDKMWETRRETFLTELKQRIRDVRQGPDGLIYLLTEEVNGTVLRLEPVE